MVEYLEISDSRLSLAVKAAEQAGEAAKSVKHTTTQERKSNDTIVTEADREAEAIVRSILKSESEHPILGEEQGGSVENEDTYWVVDPIDGTHNFAYKQPIYGTAVALVEDNEPTVGVFYMPEFDYLFYAVDGCGAYMNSEPLSVTTTTDMTTSHFILSGKGKATFHNGVADINNWIQQIGCAVAAEGWCASGWVDVGVFGALAPWDMAVGTVLIREAGGIIEEVETRNQDWEHISGGKVVFGNPQLVEKVQERLSSETITAIQNSEYQY